MKRVIRFFRDIGRQIRTNCREKMVEFISNSFFVRNVFVIDFEIKWEVFYFFSSLKNFIDNGPGFSAVLFMFGKLRMIIAGFSASNRLF